MFFADGIKCPQGRWAMGNAESSGSSIGLILDNNLFKTSLPHKSKMFGWRYHSAKA